MNTLEKCNALILSLQAQLILVERMRTYEVSLETATGSFREAIITNQIHLHKLLGAGDLVTREQIDTLLVV